MTSKTLYECANGYWTDDKAYAEFTHRMYPRQSYVPPPIQPGRWMGSGQIK